MLYDGSVATFLNRNMGIPCCSLVGLSIYSTVRTVKSEKRQNEADPRRKKKRLALKTKVVK
jgi:hypothetical protein